MDKLKKSPAEKLKEVQINTIEQDRLNEVFKYLSEQQGNEKPEEFKDKIGPQDLTKVLAKMNSKHNKAEVQLFIWEVDDDLDGYVSQEEFNIMYKRCISDDTGLEPRKLFNLTQFLMYDRNFKGRVTVEETLQILYVRYGRQKLDSEIEHIFGENADPKNAEEEEKFITYNEYVRNVNERALREQKELMRKR